MTTASLPLHISGHWHEQHLQAVVHRTGAAGTTAVRVHLALEGEGAFDANGVTQFWALTDDKGIAEFAWYPVDHVHGRAQQALVHATCNEPNIQLTLRNAAIIH